MQASLESKVRSALLDPSNYTGCNTGMNTGGPEAGRASCSLDVAKIQALGREVPGAKCAASAPACEGRPGTGTGCGFCVVVDSFDPMANMMGVNASGAVTASTMVDNTGLQMHVSRVRAHIHYDPVDVSLGDVDIVQDIPNDILVSRGELNSGIYQCPPAKPKFLRFKPDGTMDCEALPLAVPPGYFIGDISLDGLKVTQQPLPAVVSCPPTQFIHHIDWSGGGTSLNKDSTPTCINRLDPFSIFKFTPQIPPNGDVSYVRNPLQP